MAFASFAPDRDKLPRTMISIIIPTFNEERYIEACLRSVLAFYIPNAQRIEILVLDGRSTDRTRKIVSELAAQDARIRLIDNPGRIQSCALNVGIENATGEWILRLDAHASYPSDYLNRCLATALRTGADNVGGICITRPGGPRYQAHIVQALTTHRFGVGNSGFRVGARAGSADTVPFGFFCRAVFDRIGLFDERLDRCQDYELNRRITRTGGTIWMDPNIRSSYFNIGTLRAFLSKQLLRQGPFTAYMWYLAPYALAPRHLVTALFTLFVIAGGVAAATIPEAAWGFGGVFASYVALAFLASAQQAFRFRDLRHIACLPPCFLLFHLSNGLGVLIGLALLALRVAPVQQRKEPWAGAGRLRAFPSDASQVRPEARTG
jgi:succinoglycan biosynthesis protein ExoA